MEASIKADAAKVENLEKRSADREVLLGKVKKERNDAMAKLAKAQEENKKTAWPRRETKAKRLLKTLLKLAGKLKS